MSCIELRLSREDQGVAVSFMWEVQEKCEDQGMLKGRVNELNTSDQAWTSVSEVHLFKYGYKHFVVELQHIKVGPGDEGIGVQISDIGTGVGSL